MVEIVGGLARSAQKEVLGNFELLVSVLICLHLRDLMTAKGVNRLFCDLILDTQSLVDCIEERLHDYDDHDN